jgi:hypothetical protein
MSKFLGTYIPEEVSLNVGPLNITGFAEGTFITIAKVDPELYKKHVGAKGEVSRTKNHNNSGTITFVLKGTSPTNAQLDLLKYNPALLPVAVKNNSDLEFIAGGEESWIDNDPDKAFADTEQNVEWIIHVPELIKSHI